MYEIKNAKRRIDQVYSGEPITVSLPSGQQIEYGPLDSLQPKLPDGGGRQGRDRFEHPDPSDPAGVLANFVECKAWNQFSNGRWNSLTRQLNRQHYGKIGWAGDVPHTLLMGMRIEVTQAVPVENVKKLKQALRDKLAVQFDGRSASELGIDGVNDWDDYVAKMVSINGVKIEDVGLSQSVPRLGFGYGNSFGLPQ